MRYRLKTSNDMFSDQNQLINERILPALVMLKFNNIYNNYITYAKQVRLIFVFNVLIHILIIWIA